MKGMRSIEFQFKELTSREEVDEIRLRSGVIWKKLGHLVDPSSFEPMVLIVCDDTDVVHYGVQLFIAKLSLVAEDIP